MKKLPITLVAVFISLFTLMKPTFSQQIHITGKVTDSLNNALPFANIQIVDEKDNLVDYSLTNNKGEYTIDFNKEGEFTIKAGYLGMKPKDLKFRVNADTPSKVNFNFMLMSNPEMLKEVVVTKDVGAKVRSDTITYNVGKYLTGDEKVLKDVLNKLPGIEVKDDGKVKAYGKDVDKIMVEGDDFFFGQQKVATENLTADAVDQVQVLNNYQANNLQKDFSQGGQTALNINIKDAYKNKISGNISGTGGLKDKYNGNANLYQFGRKLKSGLIAGFNNTGEETFSMHDYMSFGSGIPQLMENNDNAGGMIQINPGDISSGITGGSNANRKISQLGALNMNYKPSEKLKFSNSIILSGAQRNEFEEISRRFFATTPEVIQNTSLSASKKLFLGNINLSANYKPRSNMLLNYRASFGLSATKNLTNIGNNGEFNNFMKESLNLSTLKLAQYLDYSIKTNSRTLLNIGLFQEYNKKAISENLNSDTSYLGLDFESADNYRILQNLSAIKQQLGFNASISYKLKNTVLKSVTGVTRMDQPFSTVTNQVQSESEATSSLFYPNDLTYLIQDYHSALYLLKNKGLFQFKAGPSMHYYLSRTNQSGDLNTWSITPDVQLTFKFSDSHNLNFSYNIRMALPAPEELLKNLYVKNYRTLAAGKLSADKYANYHSLNGQYMLLDIFSNTLFSASAFYTKKVNPVSSKSINNAQYSLQESATVPFNETFGGMLYFDKKISKVPLSFRLNGNFNSGTGYNYIQERLVRQKDNNYGVTSSITSRFNFIFNLETGVSANFNRSRSKLAEMSSEFTSFQPYAKLLIYHKKGFSGAVSFSQLTYKAETHESRYKVLNSTLRYSKPGKPFEYSLSASNLLNLDTYSAIDTQLQENFYMTRKYSVLPGYIILRIKYTLPGINK